MVVAANEGSKKKWSDSTQAVHNGEREGRPRVSDSLTTPVCMTSTYWFKDTAELIAYQEGDYGSFEYGRYGNPTSRACEEKIRTLEGGEDCLLSASGMNSAICMLLALVPAGGHIVTTTDCYRRTRQFVQTFMPKMGISCTVLDPSDYDGLEKSLDALKQSRAEDLIKLNDYTERYNKEMEEKARREEEERMRAEMEALRAQEEERNAWAATKVQALWRGYLTRKAASSKGGKKGKGGKGKGKKKK